MVRTFTPHVLTQQRVCSYMYMASYYIQCIVVVGCSIEFTIVCMASFRGGNHVWREPLLHMYLHYGQYAHTLTYIW